jgi:hypothetical protein
VTKDLTSRVYLNATAVAKLLGVSPKTVAAWSRNDSTMPTTRIGANGEIRRGCIASVACDEGHTAPSATSLAMIAECCRTRANPRRCTATAPTTAGHSHDELDKASTVRESECH